MKKVMFALLCALSALILFMGCSNDDDNGITPPAKDKMTWATLVKTYPFLSEFPAFDGEIENVVHTNRFGLESVAFFDYKCDKSVADTYLKKFASTNFEKSEVADIYKKKVDGKTYIFTCSYAAGNFGLSFSLDGTGN